MKKMVKDLITRIKLDYDDKALRAAIRDSGFISDLSNALDDIDLGLDSVVDEAASELANELQSLEEGNIRRNGSVGRGDLLDSIIVLGSGGDYEVGPTTDHARFVEDGTSPHKITGNSYLFWDGADHPVKSVNHPGSRAKPFVAPAVDELLARADGIISDVIDKKL